MMTDYLISLKYPTTQTRLYVILMAMEWLDGWEFVYGLDMLSDNDKDADNDNDSLFKTMRNIRWDLNRTTLQAHNLYISIQQLIMMVTGLNLCHLIPFPRLLKKLSRHICSIYQDHLRKPLIWKILLFFWVTELLSPEV